MGVRIEPATAADGPAISRLLVASGLPVDGLLDHLATALVARLEGRIVGCAALEVYPDGALLRSVAVEAVARSLGIGRQLTQAALDMAHRLGVPAIFLLTTTAEHFFPRFGFSKIERDDVPAGVRTSVEFRSACPGERDCHASKSDAARSVVGSSCRAAGPVDGLVASPPADHVWRRERLTPEGPSQHRYGSRSALERRSPPKT